MRAQRSTPDELILGLISVSDRASAGQYQDEGIPALRAWMNDAVTSPVQIHERLIPDDRYTIEETIRELVDRVGCDLVFTTGGTGPARRDVTPEATLAVGTREMPGFGEQMRRISLNFVPTAILSRQVAVLRETPDHAALIVNLPGRPKSISETLGGFKSDDGEVIDAGIFASIPYCIDLIGGPYIETDPSIVEAFRPKSARRDAAAAVATTEPVAPEPVAQSDVPAARGFGAVPTFGQDTSVLRTPVVDTHQAPSDASAFASAFSYTKPAAPAAAPAAPVPPAFTPPSYATHSVTQAVETGAGSTVKEAATVPTHTAELARTLGLTPQAVARRSVQRGVPLFNNRARTGVERLELLVKDPISGAEPQCTVVWLHGMGTNGKDFESLQQEILDFGGPETRFILPTAPELAMTAQGGARVRAWYDFLNPVIGNGEEDTKGLARMHLRVSQIINEIVTSGLRAENIFLGGFSQGAAMALYSGLRQARTLAGVIALSGYLPAPELVDRDLTPAGRGTPIFMGHGAFDSVVNPLVARRSAEQLERHVDTLIWREYNMDHALCPEELTQIAQFMNTALQH